MSDNPFALRDIRLAEWQVEAVDRWSRPDPASGKPPHRGTLEIFTGGGKSLIALACVERVAADVPDLRVAIVVPSEALARQWMQLIVDHTSVRPDEVGLLGAGGKAEFGLFGSGPRVIVAVLNSAAKKLPSHVHDPARTMLVVDECHRAGSKTFSKVLDTPAAFRLGLSATPDREELDDDGEPLAYDEQVVGAKLGAVVFRWNLRDGRDIGWLPSFEIHHHGVVLEPAERQEYDVVSRRVDDAADQLRQLGFESGRALHLRGRDGAVGDAAQQYVAATAARKDLLYRAAARQKLVLRLVSGLLSDDPDRRIILFHERIDEAVSLHAALCEAAGDRSRRVVIEHSRLPEQQRRDALHAFREGSANVLVSVKSLVEGIDVPDAEVGISVASSSSVRQRIQSLGRVLRRRFSDPGSKRAEMHVVYVADTVDESIYGKQDWSDITGDGTNHFWKWSELDGEAERLDGPPRTPRPTEEMEWERLGRRAPLTPEPWFGAPIGQEYSVDTMGNVTNMSKTEIANPQGVGAMVFAARKKAGGRFRVTPLHRLVLVYGEGPEGGHHLVVGQLAEPFRATEVGTPESIVGSGRPLSPGDPLPGRTDKEHGTFLIRQRRGGVIERTRSGGITESALTDSASETDLAANARRVLDAWRNLLDRGVTFHVNAHWQAWYAHEGMPRFLADIPGGFAWPNSEEGSTR